MKELIDSIKFDKNGLVPAIVQDSSNGRVLMLAYMNSDALQKTIDTGYTHFFSRSRNSIWKKGETSGHVQKVVSISPDCDNDALLIKVEQHVAACHTGHYSCFFTEVGIDGSAGHEKKVFDPGKVYDPEKGYQVNAGILKELYDIIVERKRSPKEGSYTCYLFEKGLDKILKKVGEECTEVVIAAKNQSHEQLVYEIADLVYHVFVLMVDCGLQPEDIYRELKKRR